MAPLCPLSLCKRRGAGCRFDVGPSLSLGASAKSVSVPKRELRHTVSIRLSREDE